MHNETFRESTARLLRRIHTPLLEHGVISRDEFELMHTYISSLVKRGTPPPTVTPKLIRAPEVAELLDISYAEFRKLDKEGFFPFKRRSIGKSVRYFYPDIVKYMELGCFDPENTMKE
jgi:predicted DNA-binding transcriptional regulator AlpA